MVDLAPISQRIWDMKYRLKQADGTPVDESVEDSWMRVAKALAEAEQADVQDDWARAFYAALQDFRVMPAGRIVAGAGSARDVTLFNCFVMGTVPDTMDGIFSHLREAALTMQQGGGIGYDFSTIRPRGAPVRGVGSDASGPVSFMDVWDAMCRTIMSAGSRRGAMMGCLRCDHPDIEEFVDAKQEPGRLRMFNVSVLATDAFMQAVREDADWPLVFQGETYRTLKARRLWDRIMRATYQAAEPGVIFIDRINQKNNMWYAETISSTNPCGEQPLPPYGACLLGSINLARLVERPFTAQARLDTDALADLTHTAVRMLDNAIDISRFPLETQRREAQDKRRIGLGVTGLADALAMVGLTYGAQDAVSATESWMATLQRHAYLASTELAQEKGAFPLFDADRYLAGETIRGLDADVRRAIADQGMRNALVTSVAPTGTISLFADNVSSGLEPIFSFAYTRNLLAPDGSRTRETVQDYAVRLYRQMHGEDADLPASFVDAQTLSPSAHLVMQAAVQKYVDSSVSKTINLPEEIAFEAFKDVYLQAYDMGCKGCTTYRPNPVTGAVLETSAPQQTPADGHHGAAPAADEPAPARQPAAADGGDPSIVYMTQPLDRPEVLPGRTYKLKWPESDHALYITLNDVVQDGRRRPFEIFINSKNMEHYAWTVALTRMISAVFRRGGDVSFVVEELKAVFDPRGGAWLHGSYKPSLLAAIGEVIEQHMIDIGFLPDRQNITGEKAQQALRQAVGAAPPRQCPRCGQAAVVQQEGCEICTACGHSTCT
ncbi:adenosylcobalamin-dependent ribonucleoside-diphosphate reductase [Rhodovibrio salinarum]|uniref:Vitamin B12-dependent ribonucleotide reductase n=1 Tax=Rhodovibrio salinarum TaxID=1087 RepID=A0A934QHR5_9PROT|nr:adenosylcobalamin-dependent ribonucleoside-diphosphate reductase [Rhodovibrio salinarum]MBK1697099.1 ribonucleoside-diphosphate reductase, adenosylcobalamin-dependent [Rhodovibrio salinarum]